MLFALKETRLYLWWQVVSERLWKEGGAYFAIDYASKPDRSVPTP